MTVSSIIPATDLAPNVASRIVDISTADMTEGAPGDGQITFWLSCDLYVPKDGVIIQGGPARAKTITLSGGRGSIRLPTYDADALPSGWVIWVKKSWAGWPYPIRIPVGTGGINLASITPVRETKGRDKKYLLTGAVSVSVTEGTAGGSGYISDGILNLSLSYPKADYRRGVLAAANFNGLTDPAITGQWDLVSGNTYTNAPFAGDGVLQLNNTATSASQTAWAADGSGPWTRIRKTDGTWTAWRNLNETTSQLTAAQKIATTLGLRSGSVTIAVASDSTANDGNDWIKTWVDIEAARRAADTDLRIEYQLWDPTNNVYRAPVVVKPGTVVPASGGTILTDDLNRSGEIVGSTTSGGQTWAGVTGWTGDGSKATATAALKCLSYDAKSRDGGFSTTWQVITNSGVSQTHRIYHGSPSQTLGAGVWAMLSVNSGGAASISIWKTIGGVNTTLVASTLTDLAINSATPQQITLSLDVQIQNVILTVTTPTSTKTYTTTITESDYQTLGTWRGIQPQNAAPSLGLDSASMTIPYVPEQGRVMRILNAAVGGTSFDYQRQRRATMYPTGQPIDVMIMAGGHNYGVQDASAFTKAVDAFLGDYRSDHPESLVLWSSQNPQFAPATSPVAHRDRQAAGRLLAKARGWSYVPALEAFDAQPDGGKSLVSADGIHPTGNYSGGDVDGYGSTLWARAMRDLIDRAWNEVEA